MIPYVRILAAIQSRAPTDARSSKDQHRRRPDLVSSIKAKIWIGRVEDQVVYCLRCFSTSWHSRRQFNGNGPRFDPHTLLLVPRSRTISSESARFFLAQTGSILQQNRFARTIYWGFVLPVNPDFSSDRVDKICVLPVFQILHNTPSVRLKDGAAWNIAQYITACPPGDDSRETRELCLSHLYDALMYLSLTLTTSTSVIHTHTHGSKLQSVCLCII